MSYTKLDIANALDLAVLKPTATRAHIETACALANKYSIRSVCVAPCYVLLASSLCHTVSAVIGFPHGNSTPDTKYREAVTAIKDGARELDVVINYGRFLDGNPTDVITELALIVAAARPAGVRVKAILETCYYTPDQIRTACKLCVNAGVDFVKTSTGFGQHGATIGVVGVILNALKGTNVQVKASGGIHHYEDASLYLDMGCTRLGASNFNELLP